MLQPTRVDQLVQAVEKLGIPVFLSGMARGLLGADHPLQFSPQAESGPQRSRCGRLGRCPAIFDWAMVRPFERPRSSESTETAMISATTVRPIWAFWRTLMVSLCALPRTGPKPPDLWTQTLRQRNDARDQEIRGQADETVDGINPLALCIELDTHLSDDSILVGDGVTLWRRYLTSFSPDGRCLGWIQVTERLGWGQALPWAPSSTVQMPMSGCFMAMAQPDFDRGI